MARLASGRGRPVEHENEERWLLTYADMITLLMALFMVLFSISSVNISKYQTLQQSLKRGVLRVDPVRRPRDPADRVAVDGASHIADDRRRSRRSCRCTPNIRQADRPGEQPPGRSARCAKQAQTGVATEQADFDRARAPAQRLRQGPRLRQPGQTQISARSGRHGAHRQAAVRLRPGDAAAGRLPAARRDRQPAQHRPDKHPIVVEGYTDTCRSTPPQFPSNWELSTGTRDDRASSYLHQPRRRRRPASAPPATPTCTRSRRNATAAGRARTAGSRSSSSASTHYRPPGLTAMT